MALAAGRARDSTPAPPGEAARWIERYARLGDRAPVDVGGGFAVTILDLAQRRARCCSSIAFRSRRCAIDRSTESLGFADAACAIPGADKTTLRRPSTTICIFTSFRVRRLVFANVQRLEAAHQVTARPNGGEGARLLDADLCRRR